MLISSAHGNRYETIETILTDAGIPRTAERDAVVSASKQARLMYQRPKLYTAAAKRCFRRLLKNHPGEPRNIVTDKLKSHGFAQSELIPEALHDKPGMLIAGQNFLAGRFVRENEVRAASSRSGRRNDSCVFMPQCISVQSWPVPGTG